MTPNQKAALRQALGTHSLGMVTKSMTPEELQELPEDYQVPTYTANASPLYDNQLFPKITSAEDLIDIGYATPDGKSTQSGQMAIALKKAGALNDDYTLNDTGKAMMANPADLLEEENLPLYLKSKELDLDGSGRELSWGETFGRFYKESKDSVKALYNIASGPAPTTKEEKAAFDLEVQAGLGGAVKAGATLAMGLSEIAGSGLIKALSDTEAEEDLALASLNQRFEKLDYEIKNAKAADVIDGLGEMVGAELGVGEAREQNVQTVGEEKAKGLEQRGESAGQFAAMFSPYGPAAMTGKVAFGVAGKGLGAAFKPISRSLLQADIKAAQVLDKTKQLAALQRQASGLQVATQAAEKKAVFAESMAQRLSQAGLVDRANNALRIANQFRTTGQEAATRLGGFTDEIAAVSDDLAKATQSANVADKVLQVTQKARQIPYLPITALGKTLEATGRGMIGIDKGLSSLASKVGADKAYNAMNKITSLSGLGGAGAALGLGPAAFIPAAIRATWSTAPFIKATGEYISLVGKEATKARGQIGFWKRIYEMPNKGPAHRAVSGLMDTATMGGRIPGAVSNVAKGLVASYPVDLAYEWVSEGGDFNPNILKQAAVETLFFGGTGVALGGITMGGANRIKTLQNGDALNFYRSISDPSQRVMYNGMPSDMKRVIGTFSASNPGAKIQFVDQGAGAYDRNTKTVMVNPNAANPLKPLLTHEFMHHMLNNGIGDGVVAQLVGDGFQTGGLLRGRDGSYDPQYEAFKDEYVNRLRSQHERTVKMRDAIGDPMTKSEREFQTPDEKYLAEEYFIEVNVDDMLGMAESGKLGGIAGRMIINDKARALGDAILNKSAILRDLHFRIGGVMDNKGKMVTGNGFLSGKLYQSQEVRRMFQKMVNESVGRKGGIDAAKRKARNGIEIPVTGKNDPILGEASSLWETDADGNPYLDASGEYIPLKKETDELRSQAGMLLVDDLKSRQARGEAIPDGELSYNPDNNTWSGQYLNDRQIELLNLSGRFNSKQIKQLKLLNAAARDTSNTTADPAARGHRFSVIYQPALKKNRKGQWRYDQIKPQLRDVVPYGVEINKDGNILIRVMSTNQLFANASEKSASKRGRALYDGNMETILRDVNAVIDSHGKNQPTDAYFKDKYGGQWEQHKSFINSVFGNVGAGQKDINPLVASDRVDAVVKSYRLDRMNKATQLVGSTQLPYQNNLVKINYLPEGEPIMDADGEPKDLRYTPSYEAVSQVRMPEQARQMPESSDIRYMPEPLPQNYKSSRDQTFLKASIGPDGIVNLSRPLKSTEALPPISTRHEYPEEDFKVSKFNKRAAIKYATNKKGEDITFKFDPKLMRQPAFGDFDQLYNGATVQLAMADRHGATDGDMGGHSFPDLKVNQENTVDDGNGNSYKLVWSNNAWGPVKNMSTKAQKYGATTLLTYNMDQHAHDSNTRTVRIFSNEIENSNLSIADQSTLLIVMNVALKKAQSSANKKTLRSLLKTQKDLIDALKKDDKAKAKKDTGENQLSAEDRLMLENNIEGIKKDIDDETNYLKEALGAKAAGTEEVEVDALFRNYQNKRRAYEKMPTSALKKKTMMDAEKLLKQHQKTKAFKNAEKLLPSRELDKFSNTFKGRKALILAVKNKEASVKWGEFDSQKISQAIGDQLTGDSLHVVSSVELSSDPEFKAVYLGDDPREIARMSQAEQKAALKFKSNPNFVPHEAYLWSMLGPAESKHIFNTNQRSVLESFPDFVDEYSKLPVKAGKFTLNDPNSKASEFNIVNTIRDQSKIGIVFRAKKADDQGEPETKK